MHISVIIAILAIGSTVYAQPKSTTVACTKELIEKGNTFEVLGSIKSANSEVTYSDTDSELRFSMQNAMLTITDSGRLLCSNPIASFQFGLRMPRAWLQNPANAGSLALAMRCSSMFDRDEAASTPIALVASSTEKLTAFDPNATASAFTARAKLDQPSLRFFNCKR